MTAAVSTISVALVGNPNTGKSTLFSALAGIRQHVGNYPGVTVEKKTGRVDFGDQRFEVIDLPGLYSLSARSRDEMVAVDVLLGQHSDGRPIDIVIAIVDASNLERNLYLLSQVLELGRPTIVALNMLDVAESRGMRIDMERLRRELGIPVVATQAHRRIGLTELKAAMLDAARQTRPAVRSPLPDAVLRECAELEPLLAVRLDLDAERSQEGNEPASDCRARFLTQRVLLAPGGYLEQTLNAGRTDDPLLPALTAARERLAAALGEVPAIETTARYDWAHQVVQHVVRHSATPVVTWTDRIDHILTHRLWGTLVLMLVMVGLFQAVFSWAKPLMALIGQAVEWCGALVADHLAEGALRSLLVDGVVRGVGGVLTFLPQIAILFFFIAILEDVGYMARGAYLMDRLMVRVGLSGKSFLPMLSSFACAVPGIMAARVVENERDRLTTILVAPLLTCSARLPVYALLIAAFVPAHSYLGGLLNLQGIVLAALYLLGILAAVVVAVVLKRTALRGSAPLFLMELPSYKCPSLRTALLRVWERTFIFLRSAGTLILAVSIVVWAAMYYPRSSPVIESLEKERFALAAQLENTRNDSQQLAAIEQQREDLRRQIGIERQRQCILGRVGRWIEPVVRPLGWDWRIGCAVLASFPAREVVVATFGVIFQVDEPTGDDTADSPLQAALRKATWDDSTRPLFGLPVALSILVFFALCAQCVATLAVLRQETNSWRWPLFAFSYMTALAYVGALAAYQFSTWLGLV